MSSLSHWNFPLGMTIGIVALQSIRRRLGGRLGGFDRFGGPDLLKSGVVDKIPCREGESWYSELSRRGLIVSEILCFLVVVDCGGD